jgi:hypothetical protein
MNLMICDEMLIKYSGFPERGGELTRAACIWRRKRERDEMTRPGRYGPVGKGIRCDRDGWPLKAPVRRGRRFAKRETRQ